ncbi:unnamed protein product [Lampetra planeri]
MVTLFIASLVTLILYFIQYFQQGSVRPGLKAAQDNAAAEEEEEEAAALLGWALSLKSWKSQWRTAWFTALNDQSRKCESPVHLTFEEEDVAASELRVSQVSHFQKSDRRKLDLQMQEAEEEVRVNWGVSHLESRQLQVIPTLTQGACNKVVSPPKPPRAHDWKLLVKNICVTVNQLEHAADSSQKAVATKPKLAERRVSEQSSMLGTTVSKALSSSDTELLMLNGTDPVAEAAIRQLHQSAKQKLKSPVKKSTIIISGIAKTPLSQDDELALMAGYAAAMDASMSDGSSTQDVTTAVASGTSSPTDVSEPQEGLGGIGRAPEDWESQAGEELNHTSLSMCVSEASCKKSRGSFLQKSAKLFFRRRHQRKDPGMSQSHNDLVYLESPAAVEQTRPTATLSRMLNRKSKNKSKANGSTSMGE